MMLLIGVLFIAAIATMCMLSGGNREEAMNDFCKFNVVPKSRRYSMKVTMNGLLV